MAGFLARYFGCVTACAVLSTTIAHRSVEAAVSDFLVPEEWSQAGEFTLPEAAAKSAAAQANYMLAIFEEENEGPDKSITSKQHVLHHDPGFSALAIDVAQHHLRRNNTAPALAVLKDAAAANPMDTSLPMVVASIYLRHLDKPALAERYALRIHRLEPENLPAIELLCEIFRAGGKSSRIDPLLEAAAKRESPDGAYWVALAEIRLRELSRSRLGPSEKQLTTTRELATKAVHLSQTDPKTLTAAGDVFALLGSTREAIDAYKAALEAGPTPDGVREKLANCLIEAGDGDSAIILLEQVVKKNPLNLHAYDQLAKIHFTAKNFPKAVANMRQAMRLSPVNPARFEEIIRASLLAEDTATAIQFSTEAENRFPYLTGFTVLRALALSQSGDHVPALAAFERALVTAANNSPELLNSSFYMSYGAAAERAGHFAKAAELLKKSIALDPERSAEACNYLGYMWADRNENLEEAEVLIRRALELDPENPAYLDSLGWVFYRQGRYEEALTELLRAASSGEAPDPVILEHVGDACEKLNRLAEALQYWQKALQLDPDNPALAAKIDHLTQPVARQPEPTRHLGLP